MNLSYCSSRYQHHPRTLEVTESEIVGKEGGKNLSFSCLRHIPVPQTPLDLMYRGVSSYKEREADLASLSATQPVTTIAVKISSTYQNRKKVVDEEASRIHISNIRRSLEHRLKVAKARGDKHLLNLLEAEFKQMALHA